MQVTSGPLRVPSAPERRRWADIGTGKAEQRKGNLMRVMWRRMGFVLLLVATTSGGAGVAALGVSQTAPPCDVTAPNEIVADGGEPTRGGFGNPKLSLGPFGLWPSGTVVFSPGGPGFITREGWLGMKFGWQRGVRGQLRIEGRRLDGPAPALRSELPDSTDDIGFQATYLIFTTPGCWEVTGRVGDASLTFVTMVQKIGDGPAWRRETLPSATQVPSR